MNKKILIAYATRYGSTKEIAEFMSKTLSEDGYTALAKDINDITDISGYDFIIAGSAIQMGKWLPEAREFMQAFKNQLNNVPLFVYSCGITLNNPDDNITRKALFATDEIKQYVSPKKTGLFAGSLDKDALNKSDRDLILLARPDCGDYRNFEGIKEWIKAIESEFLK
ncbi:MAG: flavodoxin domain-containing protein [Methanomicrobium sp.]|nr:flavodoxin domain-containing protein [Methanomicrobium sp.]MDD4299067.1 flavodoxin domain-containing protein [Methanomicrobium sp.]